MRTLSPHPHLRLMRRAHGADVTDDADLALLTGPDVEDLLAAALAAGGQAGGAPAPDGAAILDLLDRLPAGIAAQGPVEPVHGDFYEPHWPEATRARLALAEQWLDSAVSVDRTGARPLGRG